MRKLLIFLLIIILSNTAAAIGVVPSRKDVNYEPGKEVIIELMITNNERKDISVVLSADGELAQYMTVDNSIINIDKNEESKIIKVKFKMPDKVEKQGTIPTEITLREVERTGESATLSAMVSVASKINLRVPYSGKYAEATLLAPEFVKGQDSNFAITVTNYGEEDIEEAQSFIDIIGPMNNKITTLVGEKKRVNQKETVTLIVPWKANIEDGPYKAAATVVYDQKSTKAEANFQIGSPTLKIDTISVTGFTLGSIAKFDIVTSSNWGITLSDVFGTVKVMDDKTTYTSYKTATLQVEPYSKQVFPAYWDTSKVVAGKYKLDVTFNYLEKQTNQVYDILVEQNSITIPTAMASTEVKSDTKTSVKVIAAIVLIVLAITLFNSYLLWKRLKKQ